MIRLPWRRADPARSQADVQAEGQTEVRAFDALIDVDAASGADAAAVARAVRGLPGAGWISVEVHARPGPVIRLFPPGSSQAADWPALRARVAEAVRGALPEHPALPSWTVPTPAAGGFAEMVSATQFDALERLAALARTQSAPEPPVPDLDLGLGPGLGGPDTERLTERLLSFVLRDEAGATAAAALRRFGSHAAILAAPEAELRAVPGLGTHSIAAIKLVHAAAIRLARAAVAEAPVLDDPARLAAYLATALARERVEQFRILFLDGRGMLKADEVQATGTVNHTPVYPREVVRRALALGAASLILVHNHPSGDPEPSREDVAMTRQVQQAAAVMDIAVRDHVIIGNGRWLSFREAGLLN